MPRFPYVLVDNCFFIKINRKESKTLPMAHVQISSEYLAAVGVEAAEIGTPQHVLQELGGVGWSGSDMVQRYAHLSNEHLAQWVDRRSDTVFATVNKQADRLSV